MNLPNPWNVDNRNRVPEQRAFSASKGRTEASTWTHPPALRDHRHGLLVSQLRFSSGDKTAMTNLASSGKRDIATTTRLLIGLAWGWNFRTTLLPTRGKYRPPPTSTSTTTTPTTCPCRGLMRTNPTTRCPWTRTAAIEQPHRGSLRNLMINFLSRGDTKPQQGAFEVLEMDLVD